MEAVVVMEVGEVEVEVEVEAEAVVEVEAKAMAVAGRHLRFLRLLRLSGILRLLRLLAGILIALCPHGDEQRQTQHQLDELHRATYVVANLSS